MAGQAAKVASSGLGLDGAGAFCDARTRHPPTGLEVGNANMEITGPYSGEINIKFWEGIEPWRIGGFVRDTYPSLEV